MGTGKTLHEPFVSKVLIYSPVAEVNITLGGGGLGLGRPGCEQWLSDITDTHTVEAAERDPLIGACGLRRVFVHLMHSTQ